MKQPATLTQLLTERKEENGTYIKTQSKQLPVSTSQQRQTVITQHVLYFLQKYPTIDAFYKVFNPQRMVFVCQDPQYCFFGPSPTLTQIDIMYGPLSSAKWLVPLIADTSLSCGLKEDVSESQLQFTAVAISNRYRWLKAGELMLFFFNFKAGFYERFYSYFDTQTIIRSFKSFLEERALTIAVHERELSTYKGVPQ